MDENARKRKRALEGEDGSDFNMDVEKERPGEGLKATSSRAKKQKPSTESNPEAPLNKHTKGDGDRDVKDARAKAKADRRKEKLERKKDKQVQKEQKQEAKKVHQGEAGEPMNQAEEMDHEEAASSEHEQEHEEDRIQPLDVSGLFEEGQSTATTSAAASNASTASVASAASSSSSIPPPPEQQSKKRNEPLPKTQPSHDAFRARLTAKLAAMRAARKADGSDGQPAKNRAELIEARRKKEAERKAARKAQKQLVREDEERIKAEEQLARIRGGSGSPSIYSQRSSPEHERNFNFGRVAWKDGQQLEGNLSGFLEERKKKGRSDPKTAFEAAKNKQSRLNALDEQKRKDILEKDLWLNAKKRAQGERVHDDAKLLKKTVKRLEKAKTKSTNDWNDRKSAVEKSKAAKQKKREENLRKRREEKGVKGKKKGDKKPVKKGKRAGFEGSFKSK